MVPAALAKKARLRTVSIVVAPAAVRFGHLAVVSVGWVDAVQGSWLGATEVRSGPTVAR